VDYSHIKAWLTMQDLGMSAEAISSNNQNICDGEEYSNGSQDLSGKPSEFEKPVLEETEDIVLADSPRKRQKVEVPEQDDHPLVITEASFLDWLQKFENGDAQAGSFGHIKCSEDLRDCLEFSVVICDDHVCGYACDASGIVIAYGIVIASGSCPLCGVDEKGELLSLLGAALYVVWMTKMCTTFSYLVLVICRCGGRFIVGGI
ncbi:hypothetical protein Tco_0745928, partial [Tanacetum coccineum]